MTRIILPTDFSGTSIKAARFAVDLFGIVGTRYTLVNSYLRPAYNHAALPDLTALVVSDSWNGLRRMERWCRKYATGISVAKVSTPTLLPEAINDIADSKGSDMVVMGTQGEGLGRLVGSNTIAVLKRARTPVITVPSEWEPVRVQRILLALDPEPIHRSALNPLVALAKRTGAEVVVAHVRSNVIFMEKTFDREAIDQELDGIKHSYVTVQGDDAVATINDLARSGRIQLVATVHRDRGFWDGLFHASKAKRMVLHTRMPVLVLHHAD